MGITAASFKDYDTYKKDLHLTVRTVVMSNYTYLTGQKGNVVKPYLICGKFHKAIVASLKDHFDSHRVLGKGTYEHGVFLPETGRLKTGDLKDLGIDKITSVRHKALNDDDLIPGLSFTVAGFKEAISAAKTLLSEVPFPDWKSKLESDIEAAEKHLGAIGTEAADYDAVGRFVDGLPLFRKRLKSAISLHKQITELARLAVGQRREGEVALEKESEQEKPDPVVVKKAQAKVERFSQAIDKLKSAIRLIEKGPDSVTEGERALNEAKDFFKSVTDFNEVDTGVKRNDSGAKLQETIQQSSGLADLYSTIKQRTIQAIKSSGVRGENAKLLKIVLKDLFGGDLGSKLAAVDKTADKPIDARKPYIEKAIITTRQYIKTIAEIKEGDLPALVLNPLQEALVHIQSQLTTLYTSKPLPEQK